ncbi:MAG: DNA-processing protein DprA [Treponema sp.]|jgi:DNA processing protein|nr:DNA-processing protein DprA [Treponema sp.]
MDERGLLDLLISRLPGLSRQEKIRLCESFNGEADLIRNTKADIEQIIGRALPVFWNLDLIRPLAEQDARASHLRGINWVTWISPAYPPLLREIYDPPLVLFFRGQLPDPQRPLAAVVGTRRPSPQASAAAFDIARDMGQHGISVVSGLALGIDALAHRGNIDGGVATFAVLGSGADEVYPASNRILAKRILESGGALLSEYPPGTKPRKWNFPERNRIISGLCRGVLIVEAPERSGALITARCALDQNRDLWVSPVGACMNGTQVRGFLYDRRGTAKLALDGAGIIGSAADILKEWNLNTEGR